MLLFSWQISLIISFIQFILYHDYKHDSCVLINFEGFYLVWTRKYNCRNIAILILFGIRIGLESCRLNCFEHRSNSASSSNDKSQKTIGLSKMFYVIQ